MTDPINQEHEEVLNFAHSLPSGLTKEQIYVRIHERARAEILGIYHSAGARHAEEINALHRRLAAETLRADQGWQRYEAANADRNTLRAAIPPAAAAAGLPADEPSDDYKRGWEDGMKEATELLAEQDKLPKGWYETLDNINWETFGEYGKDTARQAAECCMNALEELEAEQSAALPADPVDESQPADERAKFDAWWSEFTDEHDDWCYADSSALRWAAFKAGAALSAPVAPVTPKAIEEITDILLWPVTEDDARTARDMLQSIHFDLSMAENVAPVPAASDLPALLEEAAKALESSAECDEESDVDPFAVQYARDLAKRLRGWAMEAQSHE
jgi:hypothetical protein